MFIEALFTIAKAWKHPKAFIDRLMDKDNVTYTYNGIVNHNKEILQFATTRMKLEGIKVSGLSQTEKDKFCMISLICGILKN